MAPIGIVAQLVRAPGCHPEGREFESRRSRKESVMRDHTETKRCPFCLHPGLHTIRQSWSFKDENADKHSVKLEMYCDECKKTSVWQWVEKELST